MSATRYEQVLLALAGERDDLVVMTAENRAAIRSLPSQLGPRFVDVGICEQTLVGAAAGLALRGRRPIVHALASFLTMRAFEFVRTDVGLPGLPVILVGYVPGALSEANGPTHQALEDLALMRGIPGLEVFSPADEEELCAALPVLLERGRPCYVRYVPGPAVAAHDAFVPGRAEVLSSGGGAVSILTHGLLVREALRAARLLEERGLPTRVVHVRTLEPLDEAAVLAAARAEILVTLEDHFLRGGLYGAVAEVLLRHGRSARVLGLGFEQRFFHPARLAAVLDHEGLSGARVAARVLAALRGVHAPRPAILAAPSAGATTCPLE